jgi:2-oxoacid:acceptor oxidoreductase gamma subunit (pyruvate/2-ketoisovalerate family)
MKEETLEIRWHGRGGQGAITAAKIVAQAAFNSGYKGVVMAPSFGTERRGAPVDASLKISRSKIHDLGPILSPDVVVVLDDALLEEVDVTAGMKPGGILVINTPKAREDLDFGDLKLATADVTGLAEKAGLKRGIVNTGIIGALAKALPIVPLELLLQGIEVEFEGNKGRENAEAARMTYESTEAE